MVRSLAVGFGMLTALAVAGSMTPIGQGVLGQRHPTEHVAPVSSIQDSPVAIPGPAQSLVAAPVAPKAAPAPVPAQQRPQAARVAPRPQAARAGQPSQASQPAQAQNGQGGVAGIANILLNLPQILDQTHVGPSNGSDSWSRPTDPGPGKPHKQHHWVPDTPQHKDPGDND